MGDDEPPCRAGAGDQNRTGAKHDGPVVAFDDLFACGSREKQQGILVATRETVASNSFGMLTLPVGDEEVTEVADLERAEASDPLLAPQFHTGNAVTNGFPPTKVLLFQGRSVTVGQRRLG